MIARQINYRSARRDARAPLVNQRNVTRVFLPLSSSPPPSAALVSGKKWLVKLAGGARGQSESEGEPYSLGAAR